MHDLLAKAETFTEEKLKEYLEGLKFPATKEQIVAHAKQKKVPGPVVGQLERLPDKTYNSPTDIAVSGAQALL